MNAPLPQHILIVDDDPLDREVYKRYLAETPDRFFTFHEEATGAAAIERLRSFHPDCIVLDFNLPDMNGLEVLAALKDGGVASPVPVVMLTNVRSERVAVEAMKRGVMDYLPKGQVAAETLPYAIDSAIEKFRLQREIDDRRRDLESSETRYRGLIEAIPQIVWTATPSGAVDYANSRWFEYVALGLEDLNRKGWAALLHPDDRERFGEAWNEGLRSRATFQIEHRLKQRPDGGFRWYLTRAVPIPDELGRLAKWFGTSTDIEDQKRAEIAVLNKQKLESIGLLAGGIAHDFNNLLVGILGGASYAVDALPQSHPLQSILAGIVQSGERAAHLTRQMLAYAGKGRFLIERVDLGELTRSTFELIKSSIPQNVRVVLQTRPGIPPVEADSAQMQQIAMNLILNAAEAIDDAKPGTVTVKTDVLDLGPDEIERLELVSGTLLPGRYLSLEVEDTGSGMDAATKAKVFDPFFTTKFTGRGLGLSAVQGILRTQKGAVEIRSAPGKGSTFRVFLPASHAFEKAGGAVEERYARGAGTILVVDDEEIVRRTAKASLEFSGFGVLLVDSGEKAVSLLLDTKVPISLLVLDMSMPGMSGREVLQQIRRLGIEVPVLICSGFSEGEVYREFAGLDIAGFIQKPFTARQLGTSVSRALHPDQANA